MAKQRGIVALRKTKRHKPVAGRVKARGAGKSTRRAGKRDMKPGRS